MASLSFSSAARAASAADPVVARLVREHGMPRLRAVPQVGDRFESIARAIAYQQLAGAAAATIWGRVRGLVAGPFRPESVLGLPVADLRAAGLSAAKTAALLDLAEKSSTGEVDLPGLGRRSDETVIDQLTRVRGIGRWTAEMFLIFGLRRPDVWPVDDFGVRVGWSFAHGVDDPLPAREFGSVAEHLRPYRSVVAWYCWREVEAVRRSRSR